jgi:hypothetical protein
MGELDDLKVYGETSVGWCAATPPNEFLDRNGEVQVVEGVHPQADPRAPAARAHDHPEVAALRARFKEANGITGLEVVGPHETKRAARIFLRDGFVVVRDVLSPEQLETFRVASARVLRQILEIPGQGARKYLTESGRHPHRYSYGTASASRQLLHEPVWASMIDLPTTTPILTAIFGGDDYQLTGAGGDLCLPGAIEYQPLHADFAPNWSLPEGRIACARRHGLTLTEDSEGGGLDHASRQLVYEHTPPWLTINFLMSDFTWENGPVRQIPGTQALAQKPPTLADEPEWMRLSTLVGGKAGWAVFRDNRAWHGGTPNLSREIRAMPNVEYAAPWVDMTPFGHPLPYALWETLSPHAQKIGLAVRTEPGVWPAGAGVMHPLSSHRKEARQAHGAPRDVADQKA